MEDEKAPSNTVVIAKFFELRGKEAMEFLRSLSAEDKDQLGDGIRNGTLSY